MLIDPAGKIDVSKINSCLERCLIKTIMVTSQMSEARDPYTACHQKRVAQLSLAIANKLQLDEKESIGIYLGALIHDIGKIKVPTALLSFPGKLSVEQYNLIKKHSTDGEEIIHDIEFPWPIREIVLHHHERIDGSGYPHGLKGINISLPVKIVSVADAVEAMSSHRPYRAGKGIELALKHIKENSGILYDAKVVVVCNTLFLEENFEFQTTATG